MTTRQAAVPTHPAVVARRIGAALVAGGLGALALAVFGAPWPVPLNAPLVAHAAGMVAGYQAAIMLVLMSRTPTLERQVGPDRLARWHSRCGRLFVVVVVVHGAAAVQAWSTVRGISLSGAGLEVLGMPWLVAATVGTALFVLIAVVSVRTARRRLSYERWHAVHLLAYVAIGLSFVHELAGPDLAGHRWIQVVWSLLYAWAFGLVARYRVLDPLLVAWRHRLRVVSLRPEADGVVSILMYGHHLDELRAESGQFFRWRFLTSATWQTAHPFSLSAPPTDRYFRITVKELGRGSGLVQRVRPGTLVLAEGPSGAMTGRRRSRPAVLLMAGGVGITPMRALFETIEADAGNLTLLYRASRAADVVFRDEIEAIARRRGAQVIWLVGSSRDPANALTGESLRRWVPDVVARDVYLCASPGLARVVKAALAEAGVPRRQVHEEDFAF